MSELRPVFYVSDGTGITAETIGHSLLTQFAGMRFQTDRLSFVDDEEKARDAADRIRRTGERLGARPIVVSSTTGIEPACQPSFPKVMRCTTRWRAFMVLRVRSLGTPAG